MPSAQDEDFLRLFTRHEPELRAFVRSCLPAQDDVDEVMQETSLAAWKKFHTLPDPKQFPRWACLIARYEILKRRRAKERDRFVLDEDVINALVDEAADDMSLRGRQLAALEACIGKLPKERRELSLAAYAPGMSKKVLARQLQRSEGSVYQLLARIRQELWRCVEATLATERFSP
jgi:RNA polymerase sigma-70 factor, ECF subfamily